MIKKIKSWKERLVGLDNPTTFAERQAAIQEAADKIGTPAQDFLENWLPGFRAVIEGARNEKA